jgi:Rod binding domain-containing protein
VSASVTGSSRVSPSFPAAASHDHQSGDQQAALNGRARDGMPLKSFRSPKSPTRTVAQFNPDQVPEGVKKAAQGMEAMFLSQMYKAMRKTVPNSPMSMNSNASKIYQGMLDWEYAQTAARTGGVGLSDLVVAYLMRNGYNKNRAQPGGNPPPAREKKNQASATDASRGHVVEEKIARYESVQEVAPHDSSTGEQDKDRSEPHFQEETAARRTGGTDEGESL